jgi:glycosyltransferase involved in cell wall biosynthesis
MPQIRCQIVTPVFNEERIIGKFIQECRSFADSVSEWAEVRVLLVDDGSTDVSLGIIQEEQRRHPELVDFISFCGNFGHQAALTAGLAVVDDWAEVIVTMDSDLEHPFSVVREMLETWKRERPVVVNAVRLPNQQLPFLKRFFSNSFYRFISIVTGLRIATGQADFRLWDGKTMAGSKHLVGNVDSLRLFAAWLPGKKIDVPYEQPICDARPSRYSFRQSLDLTANSFFRFSNAPFRVGLIISLICLAITAAYGAFVVSWYVRGVTVQGWASVILLIMFFGTAHLVYFSILAFYLRRLVFRRQLPKYVIRTGSLRTLRDSEPGPV